MRVGLFYRDIGHENGPAKVANNLVLGLGELGIEVIHNELAELNGCLQSWCDAYGDLPRATLMGPNLMVLPADDVDVWSRHGDFVTPSAWTDRMYRDRATGQHALTAGVNLHIWSVGIDTDRYRVDDRSPEVDCLVYFKGRERGELATIVDQLARRGLSSALLEYGTYREDLLLEACRRVRFAILLTQTESQGIGYLEILSTGTPCLVFNCPRWTNYLADSAPYFDERCGFKVPDLHESHLDRMLAELDRFRPRDYVVEHHTLEQSARRYVDLLCRSHGVVLSPRATSVRCAAPTR